MAVQLDQLFQEEIIVKTGPAQSSFEPKARYLPAPTMRQFARPLLVYGSIIGTAELALFLQQGGFNFMAGMVVYAATSIFCCTIVWLSMRGVKAYVAGLEACGVRCDVIGDEISWWGERRLKLKTSEGVHRVESVIGSTLYIRYCGPSTFGWQRISLFGAHRAGQEQGRRLTAAESA